MKTMVVNIFRGPGVDKMADKEKENKLIKIQPPFLENKYNSIWIGTKGKGQQPIGTMQKNKKGDIEL